MTPKEVYELPVIWESFKITPYLLGFYYNHIKETGLCDSMLFDNYEKQFYDFNKKVLIKVHCCFKRDSRRYWLFASVWYKEVPFMVIQNAERKGDDGFCRFISNPKVFAEAIQYLSNIAKRIFPLESPEYDEIRPFIDTINIEVNIYDGSVDTVILEDIESHKNIGHFCGQEYYSTMKGNSMFEDFSLKAGLLKKEEDFIGRQQRT